MYICAAHTNLDWTASTQCVCTHRKTPLIHTLCTIVRQNSRLEESLKVIQPYIWHDPRWTEMKRTRSKDTIRHCRCPFTSRWKIRQPASFKSSIMLTPTDPQATSGVSTWSSFTGIWRKFSSRVLASVKVLPSLLRSVNTTSRSCAMIERVREFKSKTTCISIEHKCTACETHIAPILYCDEELAPNALLAARLFPQYA